MVETNPYETPFRVESTTGLWLNRERQDASPTARRDSTRVIPAAVCLILGYSLVGMSLLWIYTTWNTTFGSAKDFPSRLITPAIAVGMASGGGLAFSCISPMAAWVVAFGYPHVPSWMFFGLWRIPNRDQSPVLSVAN